MPFSTDEYRDHKLHCSTMAVNNRFRPLVEITGRNGIRVQMLCGTEGHEFSSVTEALVDAVKRGKEIVDSMIERGH